MKAMENSWPSQVYILQYYKSIYYLDGEFVEVKRTGSCSGTLINTLTVLTAAHCALERSFNYIYNGKSYNLMFKKSADYPTFESTFTIYLGVNDIHFLYVNKSDFKLPENVVQRSVSRIILVAKLA